mgnify:CR=1 FL=1
MSENELENSTTYDVNAAGSSAESTPRIRKRKSNQPIDDAVIADHLKMIVDATNRFSESYEKRNYSSRGDAAFAEYIISELSMLPEEIKDRAKVDIMAVLMEHKRMNRNSDM